MLQILIKDVRKLNIAARYFSISLVFYGILACLQSGSAVGFVLFSQSPLASWICRYLRWMRPVQWVLDAIRAQNSMK